MVFRETARPSPPQFPQRLTAGSDTTESPGAASPTAEPLSAIEVSGAQQFISEFLMMLTSMLFLILL